MKYLFQVGLHELLGHGSGKLLERGNFPANLTNPLTGKRVESFYEPGEDFKSVFSDVNSAYEECRAEAVALYLGTEERILRLVTVKTLSLSFIENYYFYLWFVKTQVLTRNSAIFVQLFRDLLLLLYEYITS